MERPTLYVLANDALPGVLRIVTAPAAGFAQTLAQINRRAAVPTDYEAVASYPLRGESDRLAVELRLAAVAASPLPDHYEIALDPLRHIVRDVCPLPAPSVAQPDPMARPEPGPEALRAAQSGPGRARSSARSGNDEDEALINAHIQLAFEAWALDYLARVARPYRVAGMVVGILVMLMPLALVHEYAPETTWTSYHLIPAALIGLVAYRWVAVNGSHRRRREAHTYIDSLAKSVEARYGR